MRTVSPQLEQEIGLLHSHICEGLGDPKRVLILYLLADGPCNVSELTEALGVSQPTVSHHLKLLRDRGLVQAEREGTSIYYSLTDPRIIQALDLLRVMLADILAHRARLMRANGGTGQPWRAQGARECRVGPLHSPRREQTPL